MVRGIELEVLGVVERGDGVADVAARLDRDESQVSRAVTALAEAGLVRTDRDGRHKRIVPSDARAVEVYRDLVREYPHVPFAEVLTGTTLEVLYHFDRPSSVAELAERSGNYRNTVNRILRRLRDRGLVANEDGVYRFTGDFDRLSEFARALVHHEHRRRLESVTPDGAILWETDDEFLAKTDSEIDAEAFVETGLPRFADYGLQFLVTSHRYYVYSADLEELSPAYLCCHTLLIEDDTRHRSYCLLLLSAVDVEADDLRERAEKYGLEAEVDAMRRYLETGGDAEDETLPPWPEFRGLAAEYEVSV